MWFDEDVVGSAVDAVPVWLAVLLVVISYLGSVYLIAPATVAGYLRGGGWRTATWPGIIIGAYALFVNLKPLSDITRPNERGVDSPLAEQTLPVGFDLMHELAVDFDTPSFPSGHAVVVTVFVGLLVLDLDVGTVRKRLLVGCLWVGAVLVSRIGLGVHFVGDIIGGVLIGIVFLAAMVGLRQQLHTADWRGVDPAEGILLIAAVLAALAVPAGQPGDALLLLGAAGVALLAHRLRKPRQLTFTPMENSRS